MSILKTMRRLFKTYWIKYSYPYTGFDGVLLTLILLFTTYILVLVFSSTLNLIGWFK